MVQLPRFVSLPRGRCLFRGGFTLVELLVVIAIVGVLAAIIIPVAGKVRASARNAECKSNLRQTYLGYITYVNENRGMVPIGFASAAHQEQYGLPYAGGWMDYYSGQLPAEQKAVVGCPVQRANKADRWQADAWWRQNRFHRTYSINVRLNMTGSGDSARPRPLASFEAPARTLLMGDGDNSDSGGNAMYYNSSFNPGRVPEPVHSEKANVVYLDGHIGQLARSEVPATAPAGTAAHLFWYGNTNP